MHIAGIGRVYVKATQFLQAQAVDVNPDGIRHDRAFALVEADGTFVNSDQHRLFMSLRFDYDSTEWDMAAPFDCGCGSPKCRGTVRGFRHLSDEQRAELIAIAPHLQTELARAGRELAGARRRSS